jgi:hypothetical protein
MTHPCNYSGSTQYKIAPCKNYCGEHKIFCVPCFRLAGPKARARWRLAFPFDVPYDLVMRNPNHADQKEVVLLLQESITFAKRQLALF